MIARRESWAEGGDSALAAIRSENLEARRRFAGLTLLGPEEGRAARHRADVEAAIERSDETERRLAERSARLRARLRHVRIGLPEVLAALPQGTALLGDVVVPRTEPGEEGRAGTLHLVNLAARPGEEDGMLSAAEISTLDLGGVDWVVLSACETGVGTLSSAEGVLGLRRAFLVAGARTVITSLWKVEDAPTRLWMRELYRARLVDGLPTDEAVRAASRAVIAHYRAIGLPCKPGAWAGFIAVGSWR